MKKSFRKRIRNIDSTLKFFLTENENYHLGILFEDYLKSPLLEKYNLPKEFILDKKFRPLPKASVSKQNINGKYVRKKPEEKTVTYKHISFVRAKDGVHVSYNRKYKVYEKELLHKFNSQFEFNLNEHNEKLIIAPLLKFNKENQIKGTHIANLLNEIFNTFEIFDENLNPAIHFNTKFDDIILPSGKLDVESIKDFEKIGSRFSRNKEENKAFQKRLNLLKNYNPDIRGKGPDGFRGYIVFGFSELNIVILETMYVDNATYVFSKEKYEEIIFKSKVDILNKKLHLHRVLHGNQWENRIKKILKK